MKQKLRTIRHYAELTVWILVLIGAGFTVKPILFDETEAIASTCQAMTTDEFIEQQKELVKSLDRFDTYMDNEAEAIVMMRLETKLSEMSLSEGGI